MGYTLAGRVAVVTGAGAVLGRAEAIGLAAEGATVIVNDLPRALDDSDVIEQITATGGTAHALPGDIGESATATAIMTTTSRSTTAGRSRRARRIQNVFSPRLPLRCHELMSSDVMRYPLRVKNTPTPSRPPLMCGTPTW